ncbi:MAG: hypothetical protein ACI9S9_004024, partial [Planctomycetota bacterium]
MMTAMKQRWPLILLAIVAYGTLGCSAADEEEKEEQPVEQPV